MSKTNKSYLAILLLSISFITTGCFNKATDGTEVTTEKKVKKSNIINIGFIGPLSGETKLYGEQIKSILEFSLEKINEKARAKGKQFNIIYEDGKCTDIDAANAFQKLTKQDKVEFIIGGVCPTETLAIVPLSQTNKILVVTPASSNSNIEGASPFTYSLSYKDDVIGKTLAKEMSKYKAIGIISEQTDFNLKVQADLVEAVKQYPGVQVVGRETFPKGVPEVRESLLRLKGSGPDAILLNPDEGVTADNLLKQLSEVEDWSGYKLFSTSVYRKGDALKTFATSTEGMIIIDVPKIQDTNLLAIKKEIEAAKGSLDSVGDYYTASTLDTINILSDLILELGDDAQDIQQALASRNFKGYISDSINFQNSSFPEIFGSIYEVKNGEIEERK